MKVRPLHNIVVIEKIEEEKKSAGGIHLVKIDDSKPRIGKVLAVGPGVFDEENNLIDCGVQVGDTVAYLKSHEKTFDVDHEDVCCVMANGILGIVNGH